MFLLRSAGCTIYEMIRFKKPLENVYSFEMAITPVDEFKEINDVILFGYNFRCLVFFKDKRINGQCVVVETMFTL